MDDLDKNMIGFLVKQQEQLKKEVAGLDAELAKHEKEHGRDSAYWSLHHERHMRQSYMFDGMRMIMDLRRGI